MLPISIGLILTAGLLAWCVLRPLERDDDDR